MNLESLLRVVSEYTSSEDDAEKQKCDTLPVSSIRVVHHSADAISHLMRGGRAGMDIKEEGCDDIKTKLLTLAIKKGEYALYDSIKTVYLNFNVFAYTNINTVSWSNTVMFYFADAPIQADTTNTSITYAYIDAFERLLYGDVIELRDVNHPTDSNWCDARLGICKGSYVIDTGRGQHVKFRALEWMPDLTDSEARYIELRIKQQ